jgi:hypothetical protein
MEYTFKLYWSDGHVTEFTCRAKNETTARLEVDRFLGDDLFNVCVLLKEGVNRV